MPSLSQGSPRASSAGRRGGGGTPPPRPSSSVGNSATPPAASVLPARIGGYTPQNTGVKNPIQFSSNTSQQPTATQSGGFNPARTKQAQNLGAFIGNQQNDAQTGDDEYDSGDGEPNYDDNNYASVLDAMYMQQQAPSSNGDEEEEEIDPTSREAVRARNQAFQANDKQGLARQQQFVSQSTGESSSTPEGAAGGGESGGLSVRQIPANTDYEQLQQAERVKALQALGPPPLQEPDPAQQTTNGLGNASEMAEWIQRGRKVLLFFTGVGTITTLIEQNALVANRMILDGAIQVPGMGGRPPGAYEQNPGLRKVDRMDLFLALILDSTIPIIIIGSIVSFLITILPYVVIAIGAAMAGEYFGEIGTELFTQFAN